MPVEISTCRVCGSNQLPIVLSLGTQHVKDFVDSPSIETPMGPLDLVLCGKCSLLQLKHTFDQAYLYSHYWYKSGTSPTMIRELNNIVSLAEKLVKPTKEDIVIDIGSNDGTLLRQYQTPGLQKVGFEPSNLWSLGAVNGTRVIHDYFNKKAFQNLFKHAKAKVITSIAMFYDVPDPNTFVSDVASSLSEDGVWIMQINYLGLMLHNIGFDNICHEHLGYYSLGSFEYLLKRHGLEATDVSLNNVNGGSFRVVVRHRGAGATRAGLKHLDALRAAELRLQLASPSTYTRFSMQVEQVKDSLQLLIRGITDKGQKTYIYGASTRGLVIIEHAKLDEGAIPFATDKNPDKWGKYLAGTGIKVISLAEYRHDPPDYLLVLPYQYTNEIALQEQDFLKSGGKLIVPLPQPRVIDSSFLERLDGSSVVSFMTGFDTL